ncbi:MAG TPA: mechanosensitive ion channel family protein [Candidatus Paceibacterota bacterium]|nr:mechanosensitive ion channel family protein [Candidatus Paceibacterota bacterium]HSA03416.1 mechanosensitive ion channel family protein [Candidatus Paceibacterota bacterium]
MIRVFSVERILRALWGIALFSLCWTVWAATQETNVPTPPESVGSQGLSPADLSLAAPASVPIGEEIWLTFGLNRINLLQHRLFGNPLWQYLASLIYLFLALYLSKFLDFVIRVQLKRWAQKTETRFDDYLIDLVHGPIKVITFVILLHIGLRVFSWPAWFNAYLSQALKIVVASSITYVALKFVDMLLNYWRDHGTESDRTLNEQIYPMVRKTLKAFIILVAVLVTSQNLGINITGILASFSVGALAVGLAAQDTLANLFGAVAILLDRPFKIGDRVKLEGGVDGVVETIGLRSTRVRNLDGHLVAIPNKTVGNATITNVTLRPNIKTVMTIGLVYDTTTAQLKQAVDILSDIFRSHPMTQDVWITFKEFGSSSLNIEVVHWWNSTDYKAYLAGMQEFNFAIRNRFAQGKLEMAYPTQTLYLKTDSQAPARLPVDSD